jgi:hypothetical protein
MYTQNLIQFLNFSENSPWHHYAADASVHLVNMKRQIYYAHRQKKNVLNQITYTVCTRKIGYTFFIFQKTLSGIILPLMLVFT